MKIRIAMLSVQLGGLGRLRPSFNTDCRTSNAVFEQDRGCDVRSKALGLDEQRKVQRWLDDPTKTRSHCRPGEGKDSARFSGSKNQCRSKLEILGMCHFYSIWCLTLTSVPPILL